MCRHEEACRALTQLDVDGGDGVGSESGIQGREDDQRTHKRDEQHEEPNASEADLLALRLPPVTVKNSATD